MPAQAAQNVNRHRLVSAYLLDELWSRPVGCSRFTIKIIFVINSVIRLQYASHHSTYKDWSITVGSNISHIPSETHCVWCWGKASDSDVRTASPIHLALSPGVPVPCKTKQ